MKKIYRSRLWYGHRDGGQETEYIAQQFDIDVYEVVSESNGYWEVKNKIKDDHTITIKKTDANVFLTLDAANLDILRQAKKQHERMIRHTKIAEDFYNKTREQLKDKI